MDVLHRVLLHLLSQQVPAMLVVYRYGSVVFSGTPEGQEPGVIDLLVPPQLRYKAGGQSDAWMMQGKCCIDTILISSGIRVLLCDTIGLK